MSDSKVNYELVLKQEKELVFPSFNNKDAWKLGSILVEKAFERNLAVAIKIVLNGNVVFQYGCPGSDISNEIWLQRKINTVNMLHRSTLHTYYMPLVGQDDICKDWHMSPETYATLGGGFPITVNGSGVIGVVAVSGLPHHNDHDLAIDGITTFLGREIDRVLE